jgi:hypothetical protein
LTTTPKRAMTMKKGRLTQKKTPKKPRTVKAVKRARKTIKLKIQPKAPTPVMTCKSNCQTAQSPQWRS